MPGSVHKTRSEEFRLGQGSWIWAGTLVACFAVLALCEAVTPRVERASGAASDARLVTNFVLGIGTIGLAGVLPVSTIAAAVLAQETGIGLGHAVALPWIAAFALLLMARSFTIYWVHRASHAIPWIWRVHRVHHADAAVDVSTALRNHPLELLIVVPVAAATVLLIGPPVTVVLAVDTLLFALGLWQHADIALPSRIERLLDAVVVTPGFHRAHHAPDRAMHDRNYGDLVPLWDRLFGTLAPPADRTAPVGLDRAHPDRLLVQLVDPARR